MSNITLPTPVALAGGALCVLGGYLLGVVLGPETVDRSTAEVASYDASTRELCLTGPAVEGEPGESDGELCGVWRRSGGPDPEPGDRFRYVVREQRDSDRNVSYLIYGGVPEAR